MKISKIKFVDERKREKKYKGKVFKHNMFNKSADEIIIEMLPVAKPLIKNKIRMVFRKAQVALSSEEFEDIYSEILYKIIRHIKEGKIRKNVNAKMFNGFIQAVAYHHALFVLNRTIKQSNTIVPDNTIHSSSNMDFDSEIETSLTEMATQRGYNLSIYDTDAESLLIAIDLLRNAYNELYEYAPSLAHTLQEELTGQHNNDRRSPILRRELTSIFYNES